MNNKKLYGTAMVGTKGQIVIPADARQELGIHTGDRLYAIGSSEAVIFIKEEKMEAFIERMNIDLEAFKKTILKNKKSKE